LKKASEEEAEEEEEEEEPANRLNYEQAAHLKDEGKERFERGDVSAAMDSWVHALDALFLPTDSQDGEQQEMRIRPVDDPRIRELRLTLLLNLALGHKKLKQWRHAVNYCDEVLLDQPQNVKALYRKVDALGELCAWREAEEVLTKLEDTGDEGKKLAAQKREEWKQRQKAADGRQKRMWSAALAEKSSPVPAESEKAAPKPKPKDVQEAWCMPKVEQMSVFDLRKKGIEWVEAEDFSDSVWKDGLGRRDPAFYQRTALPLTLLAAAALAEVDLCSEFVVHCILDGNTAPFAEPHDWSVVLQRCPTVRSFTVVYVDIGTVGDGPNSAPPPMPYGALLRPTEDGRVGDRVARSTRFLGTYREFQEHCRELPGIVMPHLSLWADVPLFGFSSNDFATRIEAYDLLSATGVPSVFTQGCEVPLRHGPPMAAKVDEQASLSVAILSEGLGAATVGSWQWNRFVVPLDRGNHGIVAAHALLSVVRPVKRKTPRKAHEVKDALKKRGVIPVPYKLPGFSKEEEFDQLRRRQWEAFCEKMRLAGRPVGVEANEQERFRQSMEFYQFCGMNEMPPP